MDHLKAVRSDGLVRDVQPVDTGVLGDGCHLTPVDRSTFEGSGAARAPWSPWITSKQSDRMVWYAMYSPSTRAYWVTGVTSHRSIVPRSRGRAPRVPPGVHGSPQSSQIGWSGTRCTARRHGRTG